MMHAVGSLAEQREWLAQCFDALTTEWHVVRPSEWAETHRYLPASTTSLPGPYNFSVAPYLREILDCLSVDSPVREVAIMKGVQIGATVGVLENAIGYYIDHVKTAPCMLVTADAELAQLRVDSYITPMLQFSGLDHLIKSADEKNNRKTGKTSKKIEWIGGGFLVPFGAQNANKLRSISIQVLLRDEIDGWPEVVGKDGDPIKLSADRTAAYEGSRKILDISTPLIKGQSKIEKRFLAGDQRHYFVCCLKCGHPQTLRWRRVEDGIVSGIVWQTDDLGRLVPDSVRYLCERCQHPHTNDDKTRLLSPDHGAEWRPTAEPVSPDVRSYHLSALYSPVGMQTWSACVHKWLEAWDVERNQSRDNGKLQVFYNNVLGEPFVVRGERITREQVSSHRRQQYRYGEVPNEFAKRHCGSEVLLLTCGVDVHKDNLAVAVFGWCRGRRTLLIDYWRFGEDPSKPGTYTGNTENLNDPATWGRLRQLIEDKVYVADDGAKYRIQLTLIDSGYRADDVYQFASEYSAGVYPVKGREHPPKAAVIREFSDFTTPLGTIAYGITVDIYKDRWSAALRRSWDGLDIQDDTFFNAPSDASDRQLRELTVEAKRERIEKSTGKRIGFEWFRPSGADNELWDLLVYNNAALDMLAAEVCITQGGAEYVSWPDFYHRAQAERLFFER
jgi:phage terminase large subunit GpA-like protein